MSKKATVNKNAKSFTKIEHVIPLAASALFLAFTLFVFAPLEMYLGNLGEFWFSPVHIAAVGVGLGALVFISIIGVGHVLKGVWRDRFSALCFGLGLAVYVQGNFMNINLGKLDGDTIDWQAYHTQFIINGLMWVLLIAVPVVLAVLLKNKIVKPMAMLAALLTLMQAVTLCVLVATASWSARPKASGYISTNGLMQVATGHNVVVLVLDMYNAAYFDEILAWEPQLADELSGFTIFDNCTSSYSVTAYALPAMLTGKLALNEATMNKMMSKNYDESQYWRELKQNNYKLNIFSQEAMLPSWMNENIDNFTVEQKHFTSYADFVGFVAKFVASKYMPNAIKPYVWLDGTELYAITVGNGTVMYSEDNDAVNGIALVEDITVGKAENQFNFIHTFGAHMPYHTDADGNYAHEETTVMEAAHGALRVALNYISRYKEIGKYDDATIIITSDHGQGHESARQAPLMLIKPAHAKGAPTRSMAPISHMDLIPTIMSDIGLNDDGRYGKSCFEYKVGDERERMYYETDWDNITNASPYLFISTLREYTIDSADNEVGNMHKTGKFYNRDGKLVKDPLDKSK